MSTILQFLIALGAIGTLYFARSTFLADKKSRRCYLAPTDEQNYLHWNEGLDDQTCLKISLKNYGSNPVETVEVEIFLFSTKSLITEQEYMASYLGKYYRSNPMPNNTVWELNLDKRILISNNIEDFVLLFYDYVIIIVKYFDPYLREYFEQNFYWEKIGYEGLLLEVKPDIIKDIDYKLGLSNKTNKTSFGIKSKHKILNKAINKIYNAIK